MTLDQVYDELYGEIDQIKNELKNTLAQIQYASNFTEGVSLGTLSVGAESSQVIAPHVSLLPGAESGMMVLDLPVGTESAMLPVQIQDDPEATELVDDAIPTGGTVESYLNSNLVEGDITVSSGFTLEAKKIRKYMRVVSILYKGSITPSSVGWFNIGQIANLEMYPLDSFDVYALDNHSSTSVLGCQVRILSDGKINIFSFEANKTMSPIIVATYIV